MNLNWELTLKILASFAGLLGAVYQLRHFNPAKRANLKTDLEILEMISKDDKNYITVRNHIDESIKEMYTRDQSKVKVYSIPDLIFGIAFLVGFTIWSVYIYTVRDGFSYWILLTGLGAFAGFGNILNALKPKQAKSINQRIEEIEKTNT